MADSSNSKCFIGEFRYPMFVFGSFSEFNLVLSVQMMNSRLVYFRWLLSFTFISNYNNLVFNVLDTV